MASETETKIYEGLVRHLEDQAAGGIPIAYPGVTFDPPDDQHYLRVTYLPDPTDTFLIGNDDPKDHTGLLQVDVMWPQNSALVESMEMAGKVITAFRKGTRIENEGVTIDINEQPYVAPSIESPPNLQLPVSIPYQSFNA